MLVLALTAAVAAGSLPLHPVVTAPEGTWGSGRPLGNDVYLGPLNQPPSPHHYVTPSVPSLIENGGGVRGSERISIAVPFTGDWHPSPYLSPKHTESFGTRGVGLDLECTDRHHLTCCTLWMGVV